MLVLVLPLVLSGCIVGTVAGTAVDVVTLPVKAVSAGVDAATTSQAEADQKRGREIRKAGGSAAASSCGWPGTLPQGPRRSRPTIAKRRRRASSG